MKQTEQQIESLIKSSAKVVGLRQVLRGLASDELRCVVMSEDAEAELKSKLLTQAERAHVEVIAAPSMDWLGKVSEIAIRAAVVGILKS